MNSIYRPLSTRTIFPILIAICFANLLHVSLVNAELVTSSSDLPGSASKIDFSQFVSTGRITFRAGDPPIEIDEFPNETVLVRPISGTSNVGIILGMHTSANPDNNFYLGPNGRWGPGREGFLGIGGGNGSRAVLRIEFTTGPVAAVGGLFNYSPNSRWLPVIMSALDENLSVIEQHLIDVSAPVSTPSGIDVGEFRGISRPQDEIFALEISAPFAVIDDIRFYRIIPEPSAAWLLTVFIVALTLDSRRFIPLCLTRRCSELRSSRSSSGG